MTLKEARKISIFRKRVDLDEFFPEEEDGSVFVTLREPTQSEFIEIQSDKEGESMVNKWMEMLTDLIVAHSFNKETDENVAEYIKESSSIATFIFSEWIQSLPLVKKGQAS